jgi:Flp pilus assembly protein TadG
MKKLQRGQGMVEFAAISIIFFLLFFVILDGGRALYAYATIEESVREGAHQAQLTETTDAQIRAAINAHSGLLGDLGSTATITPSGSRNALQTVTISTTSQYRTGTPLLSQFGPINLTGRVVVVVE